MAIEITEKRRINPVFVVFILVIVLLAISIVYYIFKTRATTGLDQTVGGTALPVLVKPPQDIQDIQSITPEIGSRIDRILRQPALIDLKSHAALPIRPPQLGKISPFSAL